MLGLGASITSIKLIRFTVSVAYELLLDNSFRLKDNMENQNIGRQGFPFPILH